MGTGLTKSELLAVREFVAILRDKFPSEIESVRLYGSKARETANKDSDIDILIIVKDRKEAVDGTTIDLICNILDKYGVYIETVTLTSKDYNRAVKFQYPFAINIERDSIAL